MSIEPNREKMNELIEALQKGTRPIDNKMIEEFKGCVPNYEVSIKVVSQQGICLGKHEVGEEWVMKGRGDGWRIPSMCMFAFSTIFPSIQMLMYGGSFPWEPDMEVVLAPCPDSRNPVVFELKRTKVV